MNKPRIIVEVSGGVVQCVHADRPINVDVLDHDNMKGGDFTELEIEQFDELEAEARKLTDYL